MLGTPFMPWQRQLADVALEYDPKTGLPFYREVDGLVMRQSGKTVTELAVSVDRCVSWPASQRQRVIYSAQTGQDGRAKLLEDWWPMLQASPLAPLIRPPKGKVVQAAAREAIWFPKGVISLLASLTSSGHGRTVNLGFIDEAWKDADERREGAIRPAQATIQDAQLWVVSTAGNEQSAYLRRKLEAGRAIALEDPGEGICYVEYSIPDDVDIDNPENWARYMPAVCPRPVDGRCACSTEWRHTQTPRTIAADRQGMDDAEFRRAYGNQWVRHAAQTVIPERLWARVNDPAAQPQPPFALGLDVLREPGDEGRQAAALVAVGQGVCEITSTTVAGERAWDHRPGTGWVVERVQRIASNVECTVVIDGNGPAVSIADRLEAKGIPVTRLPTADVVAGCGAMYDAIADATVTFSPHPSFDAAVEGLAKRPAGDRFVWSRDASTEDITPLFAATLGLAGGTAPEPFALFG